MSGGITLTTCLYDIRKKEGSTSSTITHIKGYLELGRHMLSVRLPMVIYTDEELIVKHVYRVRKELGLLEQTLIVRLPFENTFFYKDLEILKKRMSEFKLTNMNAEKDTPLYVLLNNNKFDFLLRTMNANPFQTDYFVWMDMGIQHCAQATVHEWEEIQHTWLGLLTSEKGKIRQMKIHNVSKPNHVQWKHYFQTIYHHVAGGLFGGHQDCMYDYIKLFRDQWHRMLHVEEWWQLDEVVMTILTETYPEKFSFFYGDYDGIITNFVRTRKSFGLVLRMAQWHLDARQYNTARRVLCSIDKEKIQGTCHQSFYDLLMFIQGDCARFEILSGS